jgi:hypothetical protein
MGPDPKKFERRKAPNLDEATVNQNALDEFEKYWTDLTGQLEMISGKEALSALNEYLNRTYQVSITPTAIIDAMGLSEVFDDLKQLIRDIAQFSTSQT